MAFKRIAHTAYNIADIDKAIEYYCGKLGFEQVFDLIMGDGRHLLYLRLADAQFIELFYGGSSDNTPYGNVGSYEHLCLEVDDIYGMYEDFKARGIEIAVDPSVGLDGNTQMWIVDPFGNRIELMEYGENPLQFSK